MKRVNTATISAAAGHVLATAAFLWLLLWPGFYQGVSVTALVATEEGQPPLAAVASTGVTEERFSSSLIDENGWGVLPILLAPMIVTGLALFTALWAVMPNIIVKWQLRASAFLLFAFCLVAIFPIGLFLLPAAIAITVAAIKAPGRQPKSTAINMP